MIFILVRWPEIQSRIYEFIKQRMKHISGIINIETFIGAEVIKRYYGPSHLDVIAKC
jgi:hypothetical protein